VRWLRGRQHGKAHERLALKSASGCLLMSTCTQHWHSFCFLATFLVLHDWQKHLESCSAEQTDMQALKATALELQGKTQLPSSEAKHACSRILSEALECRQALLSC